VEPWCELRMGDLERVVCRVVNALLGACVRKRNLKAAEKLFSSLTGVRGEGFASFVTPATDAGVCVAVQPDEYSFNIMINAYARARQVERAGKMLLEMRRANCKPDKITYSTLMKAHVATGQMSRAFGLLEDMTQMDLLDAFAFNILLEGLARRKQWRQAKELLEQMEQAGVRPDLMSYSHVITACVRASRMDEAKKTFRAMQDTGMVPNRQLYSTMMAGFGATGALNEAQQLFKQMQERRVRPNEYTMSSLVEAYLKAGYAADAIKIQERLPEMQLKMDDVLETQKIRALAQQGNFSMATEALQALLARRREEDGRRASLGAIPYNEIIKQAQRQGQTAIATETLTLMLQHKVAPNRMTYELVRERVCECWSSELRIRGLWFRTR
jgi:pentatricopeptide repeat protein